MNFHVPAKIFAPIYLGDGVNACHDGTQIWLATERGEIALNDSVLEQLDRYRAALAQRGERHVRVEQES